MNTNVSDMGVGWVASGPTKCSVLLVLHPQKCFLRQVRDVSV